MNKTELEELIRVKYNTAAEHPFSSYPEVSVFRHSSNKKWFAVIMTVERSKLGMKESGICDILNLKSSQEIIPSLLQEEEGIHPGYHMNKSHWISIRLDGSVDDDTIAWLLQISHRLTSKPSRKLDVDDRG